MQQSSHCESNSAHTGLHGLSDRQRRLVERHIDLVRFAVARSGGRRCAQRHDLEYTDLLQEGSMALMEAVRAHDPGRHGAFEPYAISRIHFAVSRYAHEHGGLIRVPFVTQRRVRALDREAQREAQREAHAVGAAEAAVAARPPRVVCSESIDQSGAARRRVEYDTMESSREPAGMSIADAARPRIAGVLADVRDRLLRTAGRSPRREEIIRRCFNERWTIPEIEARTPIRQLARELGCSLGGITHCEARFEREAAEAIDRDPVLIQLRRMAKASPHGFGHRLTDEELAELRPFLGGDEREPATRLSRTDCDPKGMLESTRTSERPSPGNTPRDRGTKLIRSAKHAPDPAEMTASTDSDESKPVRRPANRIAPNLPKGRHCRAAV